MLLDSLYKHGPKALLLLVAALANPATAENPFITNLYTADPAAHVWEDGRMWVYPTHDENSATLFFDMRNWRAYSSDDMNNWQDHGVIFSLDDVSWASSQAWAPDVVYRAGTYYMYFPVDWPFGKIGVATSQSPDGPFADAIGAPLITFLSPNTASYTQDPSVFIDDDGQAYMYYGGNKSIRVVKLKENMLELDGPILNIAGVNSFFEGAWMHKYHGKYYLSYAADGLGSSIKYAMADNPLGPFVEKGVLLDPIGTSTSHQSIVEKDGQWYMFYHNGKLPGGGDYKRSIAVDKLFYNADGTIQKVIPTLMGASTQVRVNAGTRNAGTIDSEGHYWYKDQGYDTDNVSSTKDPISGTTNDAIYQTHHYGEGIGWVPKPLGYSFTVPNGEYRVKLHFAETWFKARGKRIFDVFLEGENVSNDLDIYARVGHDAALMLEFNNVVVSDSQLNIKLQNVVQNPIISGIEFYLVEGGEVNTSPPPQAGGSFNGGFIAMLLMLLFSRNPMRRRL